jgi:hypothetical protein
VVGSIASPAATSAWRTTTTRAIATMLGRPGRRSSRCTSNPRAASLSWQNPGNGGLALRARNEIRVHRGNRDELREQSQAGVPEIATACFTLRLRSQQEPDMYLVRFSYDVLPVNRQQAIELVRREVEAARSGGLQARLLIPLTRAQGGPALQFEVELERLDQFEQLRHHGAGSTEQTEDWMRAFSDILLRPPAVEIARVD